MDDQHSNKTLGDFTLDKICDDFEVAYKRHEKPRIEQYLESVPAAKRAELLRELLQIELWWRRGEQPASTATEYIARFPELSDVIESAFDDFKCKSALEDTATAGSIQSRDTSRSPSPDGKLAATITHPPQNDLDLTLTFIRLNEGHEVVQPNNTGTTKAIDRVSPGCRINNRYLVDREVGRGGMGEVYLGVDEHLQRKVAIKVIRASLATASADAHAVKAAFEEEARIGAGLVHPAIATVYDYGFTGDTAYTVFEYVAGEPMRDFIRDRAPIPLEDVRQIIGVLAQALDYAHGRGIIHRDLKPENIRFTEQGQPKILDLGLAVRFKNTGSWRFAGTPAYASPEQAAETPSDGRTDQYALALIVFELLTGNRPFTSKDWRDLLALHRSEEPPHIKTLRPEIDQTISDAIQKALSKDPNSRFTSCEAFAAAIGCQFQSVKSISDRVQLQTTVTHKSRKWFLPATGIWSNKTNIPILLGQNRFWIAMDSQIECWPISAMNALYADATTRLDYSLEVNQHNRKVSMWFESTTERDKWESVLSEQTGREMPEMADEWVPEHYAPVMLPSRPNIRCQILGGVERTASSARSAKDALRLLAASQDADAVVNVEVERVPRIDQTKWRASGTAIKSVDSEGKVELATRYFSDRIARLSKWAFLLMIVFLAERALTPFLLSDMRQIFSIPGAVWGFIGVLVLVHLWPALVTGWLWWSRIPQLARAVSISLLSLAVFPFAIGVSALTTSVLQGVTEGSNVAILLGLLNPENLMLLFFAILLSRQVLRAIKEFEFSLRDTRYAVAGSRKLVGFAGFTTSCIHVVSLVCLGFWQGYSSVRPELAMSLAYQSQIQAAIQSGRSEEAKGLAREQVNHSPTPESWSQLAFFQFQTGSYEESVQSATEALKLDSNHVPALLIRYDANMALGKAALAEQDIQSILTLDPEHAFANYVVAIAASVEALNAGQFQSCIDNASRAIDFMPTQPVGYVNRAAGFLNLGEFKKAIEDCDKAIEINPDFAMAFVNRSAASLNLGRREAAISDANRALAIEPGHPLARRNLAIIESLDESGGWPERK